MLDDRKDWSVCANMRRVHQSPSNGFRGLAFIELAFQRERYPGSSTSHNRPSHSEFLRFGIEFSDIVADWVGRLSRGEADLGAVNFTFADVFCGVADRDVSGKFNLNNFFVFFCFDVQRDLLSSSPVGAGGSGNRRRVHPEIHRRAGLLRERD